MDAKEATDAKDAVTSEAGNDDVTVAMKRTVGVLGGVSFVAGIMIGQ